MASSSLQSAAAAVITSFALNPLTTSFSRPGDCSGIYLSTVGIIDVSSTCLPPGFNSARASYFSPGLACPSGYHTACHDTNGAISITTVTCCPTYNSDISLSCVTTSTLSGVWASLYCTWSPEADRPTYLPLTVSSNGITSTSLAYVQKPGGMNAFGIRMVYQSTDLITRTTSSGISMATSSVATSTATSSQAASLSASSELSVGAIIGIAVGGAIVVLFIVVAGFFWWKKKRNNRHSHTPVAQVEIHDPPQEIKPQWHEAMSNHRSELYGNGYQHHGASDGFVHAQPVELPGSQYRSH